MANNNVAMMFVGGAIVVAVAATYGVFELMAQMREDEDAESRANVEMVTVVAASRTLYQGVAIASDDLFVVKIPPDFLPVVEDLEQAEKEAEIFASRERVVGRVPRERILANEFVRPERLADGNHGVGLNAVIPPGMRAISLDLRDSDAVTGFLEPGNYVDVLITMKAPEGELYTETLLQTVLVLGVNSRAENESNTDQARRGKQRPSVTFMVTQSQAEELAFANHMGKVSLSLRNVLDSAYTQLPGVELDALLNRIKPTIEEPVLQIRRRAPTVAKASAPAPVAKPKGATVQVIRGSQSTSVNVQSPTSSEPQVLRNGGSSTTRPRR